MDDARMHDEVRRNWIKDVHGLDVREPFEHTVFPDGTVQWQPMTILLGWLAALAAEQYGDIEAGEAFRIARARIRQLEPDDWEMFVENVRAWGIRLADETLTER